MALKDCTFFVDVNGKQVEMDYDQFRAYLFDGTNLSALAPTLVTKKGTKVGFERAEPAPARAEAPKARAEAAPARAEASTAKGEAKAQKGEAKAQKGEAAPEKGEAPTKKKEEKAAPEAKELPPNAPRPVTVENLRLTMGLNKSQAEAVMAVYKAMGLPLPMFRIAKGVFSKPELQAQYEAELEKSGTLARGFIEFFGEADAKLDGVWAIIRGFSAANVTTPIHEGAHFYRRFMLNTENGFTAQEIKAAEDWAGARNGNWSVAAEEKWARGFERYLRSGEAPLPSLTKLFEKLAKWFQNIYKTVIGSEIDVEITPEIRRVFDRIFELQTQKVQRAKGDETTARELKQEVGKNTFLQKWKATRLMPVRMAVALLGESLPSHIQAVAEFMMQQRQRFMQGELGVRDIAKAYIITVSSIQARSQHVAGFEAKTGLKVPKEFLVYNAKGEPMIRPEDAVGYWLLTPQGKKALDSLEATGKVNQRLWKPLIDMRQVFGNNTLRQVLTADPASTAGQYNLNQIREITDIIKGTKGNVKALDEAVRSFRGIAEAKSGFIQHLLGFGSTATVDAREINYWVTGQKDIGQLTTPASEMARAAKGAKGADYRAVTSRIQRQIDRVAANYGLDPNVAAHVIHHWLWDATEGTETTHEGMMKAQRLAQNSQTKATGGERTLEQRVEAETKATPVATAPDLEKAALKWAGVSRITPAHSPKAGQLLREFTGLMDKLRNKLLNASADTWRTIPRTVFIASGFAFEQLQAELSGDLTPRKRAITKMYYADSQAAYIASSSTEGMRNNLAAKLQVNPQELHRLHDIYNVLGDYRRGASPEAKALGLADETTGNAQLHTLLTPPGQFTTGKPTLVTVYHGTSEEGIKGNEFAPSFAGALTDALSAKRGYFFAGSPITPWRYARTHMLMSNLTQFGRVFKFFVKLQNPLVYDMKGSHKRSRAYADLMAEAKNAGHDGVIITNTFDGGFMADTIVTVLHGHENQIKSAEPQVFTKEGKEIPLSERFSASHNILYQAKQEKAEGLGPVWRSNIIEALKSWPQSKGTPAQFMAHLKNVKGATEEAKWVDLKSFLEGKASVTRAQIEEFIAKNPLVVDTVTIPESKADPKHLMARIKGGIDYRDVVITMPRQHQYTSANFPEAPSYVAHMRVSSFTSKDGRKIFLVDELQSDLHQGARRYGYVTPQQREAAIKDRERASTYEREAEKARTLANQYTAYLADNLDKPFNQWAGIRSEADARLAALRAGKPSPSTPLTAAISKAGLDDAFQRLVGVQKYADKMQKLADQTTPPDFWRIAQMAYPETPWKETAEWVTMAFKRAVRMAVDEGADVIAWSPGNVQAGRWGSKLYKFYDEILPQTLAKFVRQWGGKVETVTFDEPEFEVPLEGELVPEQQAYLDELNEQLQEAYEAEPFDEDLVKNLEDDIEFFTLGATRIEVPTGKVKERTFPSISITPQMKAEAQKGFTLFQAESLGGDSTANARAEAIRQNRERMQARREQAGGDTTQQQKSGGTTQQQKGGSSASRQGRTRSKPQTLSDMLRIAEEQVQAAAEREPQTDTEKRQAQAQRAVMALLRDYVRLKAQGNLPDSYTKADGTQVNREAELFDALTVMLNSATDPDDDARKATRKALSARFDEILPGRVKSKAGQPKTLQDMLREAERNIRGAAGKKVLSAQEKAQERADQEIKYLIREYAQKMYAGRLTDDLELPDGTTVSREQELLNALDALRDALKMPNEGLRLKARADAMRRVDFALLAPPLETLQRPLDMRNFLTGHAWGTASVRSPLSYLNYIGSYERIAGVTGRQVSDTFNEVRTRLARGQYRNFNSALADLRILLRPLKEQLREEGYRGLPSVINEHVRRIERSARSLGKLTWDNVRKAWMEGEFDFGAHLASSIIKAYVFNALLRFNPRAVTLNYAQSLFSLFPFFTPEEFMQLYKDSITPETQARVRDIAIKESGGRFTPEIAEDAKSKLPNPFMSASEQVRIMGHLAGEMMADRLNLPEGIERDMYIRSWAEKAEFDNSAWNAAPLFTGPLMSVLAQFKPYMFKNLERVFTDFFSKPIPGERVKGRQVPGAPAGVQEPVPQLITARQAKMLVVQLGIGGPASLLTLAPGLRMLIGPIMLGLLAKSFSEAAGDDELGEKLAEIVYFGVPAAFALDLSSSVSFIEGPSGKGLAEKIANSLGPAVSLTYRAYTEGDKIYELATRPQKVGESEAVKKELKERTWKLGKALTPYTRMVEAGYSLATGTRPEMFLDKETPLTTGETIGRLIGGSPVRQASYYEMKEAPDLAKRIVGMQPDIAGIPRERGETDKTYRVKVQRVTEWRDSYGKQLENHPRFKTLDKATKDKALEIINGNISAEAAKVKPNLGNLRPEYVIRRAKESIRQAPRRAKRQMYVPPPED